MKLTSEITRFKIISHEEGSIEINKHDVIINAIILIENAFMDFAKNRILVMNSIVNSP